MSLENVTYGDMNETSEILAIDAYSGEEVYADIAGTGFYEMLIDDNGMQILDQINE